MTNVKKIAENPHKALTELEERLGVPPGGLLADMDRLGEAGEDWTRHLPYGVAVAYYEDAAARAQHEEHVNGCTYCKELLQTIHPADVDAFVERATATMVAVEPARTVRTPRDLDASPRETGRVHQWTGRIAPFAMAASLAMVVFSGWLLQRARTTSSSVAFTSNACIADAGNSAGCALLEQAAEVRTTNPQLARALLVAGLSQSGATEVTLNGVSAALDPATPLPDIFATADAGIGNDQRPSAKSTAILTAAQSDFRSGKPIAGYEQILAYVKESESNDAAARAFESAFVQPVRASSGAAERAAQRWEIKQWVNDVRFSSGNDLETPEGAQENTTVHAGQPLYLVAEIKGAPARTPVSAVWFDPSNQEVRRETSWTTEGTSSIAFSVSDTAAWKSGEYRAELWVANEKVKQETFLIAFDGSGSTDSVATK